MEEKQTNEKTTERHSDEIFNNFETKILTTENEMYTKRKKTSASNGFYKCI